VDEDARAELAEVVDRIIKKIRDKDEEECMRKEFEIDEKKAREIYEEFYDRWAWIIYPRFIFGLRLKDIE
jgi:hypothetical protein